MERFGFLILAIAIPSVAIAQPIALNPGETLVAIDGVPVAQQQRITSQPATAPRGGSDQARAQAEANYMASRNIKGHVWGCIGTFEGVGWSSSGTPSTCTPRRRMRLVADAIARGRGGVFRVRAWR